MSNITNRSEKNHKLTITRPPYLSVLKEVAVRHEVTIQDLKGSSRDKTVVFARREAMFLLFTECGLNPSEIARIMCREGASRVTRGIKEYLNGGRSPA